MSGKQTIGLTLTAWLIVTALGFAACSRQEPPMPRNPDAAWLERQSVAPLRLSKTKLAHYEAFSDDERYRLETKCRSEGRTPESTDVWVACNAPGRQGWLIGVSDVNR